MMQFIEHYVSTIRDRAADRRREGAEPQAQVYERVADELTAEYRAYQQEVLTVARASAESGYSASQIYRLKQQLGRAELRRCDLPHRPAPLSLKRGARARPASADDAVVAGVLTHTGARRAPNESAADALTARVITARLTRSGA